MKLLGVGVGQVKIDGNVVAKIGEGRFFGEVALYSKFGRRIATVATLTYCEVRSPPALCIWREQTRS